MNPVVLLLLCLAWPLTATAADLPLGRLEGRVIDAGSLQPLAGANILVIDSGLGAASDLEGRFLVPAVPAGVRAIQVSLLGYETQVLSDLVVRPGGGPPATVRLQPSRLDLPELVVRPEYFSGRGSSGAVMQEFQREEIRRAPGSAEDVNRLVQALPSVGFGADDQRNDIVARGGSPVENLFLVDGHPIHNLNHFGSQGSTGGPIGMIHVDFIESVRFSPGGFDASHGDRLSSVMDVRFREGDRRRTGGEAFLSMAGAGVELEGPLGDGRGSWLLGARRSYLELLKEQIGYATAPVMADLGGKAVWDLSPRRQLSALWLSGWNRTRWNVDEDPDQNFNVDQTQVTMAGGLALRRLGADGAVDRWRLTVNHQDFDHSFSAWNDRNLIRNDAWEQTWSLAREWRRSLGDIEGRAGLGLDRSRSQHYVRLRNMESVYGSSRPDQDLDLVHEQNRWWGWLRAEAPLGESRRLQLSLRLDHDDDSGATDWQPRAGLRQNLGRDWALNLAAGRYAQGLPVSWRVQSKGAQGLASMKNDQLQAGLEWRPKPDWLLSIDLYRRIYRDLPVSEFSPTIPLADAGSYYGYSYRGQLSSGGEGRARGIEWLVQKKLSEGFWGSLAWSWSRSRYRTPAGQWETGPFERRQQATLILGWIPSHRWELSLKWRIAGGLPETPIDEVASAAAGDTRHRLEDYQRERQGVYHRLDLRLDHRIHGRRADIVMFWDLQNAYDRRNEAFRYWHHRDGEVKTWYGWRIMPVFGITAEF
jgi:hypothetical protein